MKLTILGSGTCVPSLKRSSPANFLKISENKILIDCGAGTLNQLLKSKVSYKDIDIVFLSHFHPDHVSELAPLIHALSWTPDFDRKKDLVLIGPSGFKSFYKNIVFPVVGNPRPNTYKVRIIEIGKKLIFKDFIVKSTKTIHSPESIAYQFIEKNKILTISGDCDFDHNLIKFSKNSDLLLLECSYANDGKVRGHLIPQECGEIAKQASVKKLILTHLYPISSEGIRLKQTKKIFKNTLLAKDLLTISI
ncbi:MBL fold metallo-hydrolase [Patescibacteria group bacterium]|nr:MBL fold metallo-hydrolase [Patescibacteria group bacterium]